MELGRHTSVVSGVVTGRGRHTALLTVVAAVVLATAQPHQAATSPSLSIWLLGVGVLLGAVGALWWRHRAPVTVLGVTAAAAICYYLLGCPPGPEVVPFLVALYSAAEVGWRRTAIAAAPAGVATVVLVDWLADKSPEREDLIAVLAVLVATVGLGELARARREHWRELRQRAAAEERLRIARELHDTLAHQLTAISVQASAGLKRDEEHARQALRTIRDVAGEALREVRGVLGVIRADQAAAGPGLAQLDQLIARCGVAVTVDVSGRLRPLPPEVDAAAYRIIQEALTNVARHSRAQQAKLRLEYRRRTLQVEVLDFGEAVPADRAGYGLAGMRERAAALGGTLTAGPRPGGGYRVAARLPAGRT